MIFFDKEVYKEIWRRYEESIFAVAVVIGILVTVFIYGTIIVYVDYWLGKYWGLAPAIVIPLLLWFLFMYVSAVSALNKRARDALTKSK